MMLTKIELFAGAVLLFGAVVAEAQENLLPFAHFEAKLTGTKAMSVTMSPCEKKSKKEHRWVMKLQSDRPIEVYVHPLGNMDELKTYNRVRSFYVKLENDTSDPGRIIAMEKSDAPQQFMYREAVIGCVSLSKDEREAEESIILFGLQRVPEAP